MIPFLFRQSLYHLVFTLFFSALAGISSTLILILVHQGLRLFPDISPHYIGLLMMSCLGYVGFYILSDYILTVFSTQFIKEIQIKLSNQIAHSHLSSIERIPKATLYGIFQYDCKIISDTLQLIPKMMVNLFIIVGCFVYLAYLSVPLFIIFASAFGVMLLMYLLLNVYLQPKQHHIRSLLDRIIHQFHSLLSGIKELQLSVLKRFYFIHDLLSPTTSLYKHHGIRINFWLSFFQRFIQVMLYIIIGVLIITPHFLGLDIDGAVITGFIMVALFVINPIEILLSFFSLAAPFFSSIKSIQSISNSLTSDSNLMLHHPIAKVPMGHVAQLRLTNIAYRYLSRETTHVFRLGPINLTISSGELTYIVGGNGSGKTTLAKLISGLYIPETGHFTLNDADINHDNIYWYRDHFSVIFSDFHLFDDLLEIDQVDKTRVDRYLSLMQLSHKVQFHNGRFSTTTLSDGQRKRLALIVAFLQDRPIYLFDEWASDQDPEFKDVFYHTLLPDLKKQNKVVIVITHDDFYFHTADRMIDLRDGQLIDHS